MKLDPAVNNLKLNSLSLLLSPILNGSQLEKDANRIGKINWIAIAHILCKWWKFK